MTHTGLLYDPASGKTQRVNLTCSPAVDGRLRVEESTGVVYDLNLAELALTRGGWRGDAITLHWEREGKTWALTVDDPQTIADLARQLPPAMADQVAAWQKKSRRGARWSASILVAGALITLLPLFLLLVLFLMRDRIVDFVVGRIPTYLDAEIGDSMHRKIRESGNLVTEGKSVDAVKAAGQRLLPHVPQQGFNFRFEVLNDPSVNAFAAPGGLVVVHTGLLAKTTSVDELIGVLSHEIAHVTRRHSLRQIVYSMGLVTTVEWVFGIPDGASVTLSGTAAQLSGLKFSRDQESDADAEGVELLRQARFSAAGLQTFLKTLAREQGNVPAFLSTHPADAERLGTLENIISRQEPWSVEPLTIDWQAVRQDAEERMKQK